MAAGGRWHEGGTREHRFHRLTLRRTEITGERTACIRRRLAARRGLLAAGHEDGGGGED
jgi:hypothetical protein